jgi:hypothetical protein
MSAMGWKPAVHEFMPEDMTDQTEPTAFEVEAIGDSGGHCGCCGNESRCVWGMVHQQGGPTVAAYWMNWTVGHLSEPGANLDLVLGKWGDGTGASDRFAVAMVHRQLEDGTPSLMVIDADGRFSEADLAATALARCDVIEVIGPDVL